MGGGLGSGSGSAIFLGGGGMRLGFGFGLGRISWKRLLVSRFTSHSGSGLSRTAVGAGMFRLAFGLRFRSAALYGMTLAPDPLMSTIVPY